MQERTFRTSTERLIRTGLFMLLMDVFALLFLWDGYVGYQKENAKQLATLLGLPASAAPPIHPRLTRMAASQFVDHAASTETERRIRNTFGEPALTRDGRSYYLGPGGWLTVTSDGERAASAQWTDATHNESDQAWQRSIGYALVLISLYATYLFINAAATRITITDDGVRVFGRRPIAWEALTGIRQRGGGAISVDVADGEPIEIEGYLYRDADQIVAAICDRKAFPNPLQPGHPD